MNAQKKALAERLEAVRKKIDVAQVRLFEQKKPHEANKVWTRNQVKEEATEAPAVPIASSAGHEPTTFTAVPDRQPSC